MDELVKRLRSDSKALFSAGWVKTSDLAREAADAIEKLSKDLERSKEWESFWEEEANRGKEKIQQYALAVANKPHWIPVMERLPQENGHYLVYANGMFCSSIYIAMWNGNFRKDFMMMDISHWMPLPEPPAAEEGE